MALHSSRELREDYSPLLSVSGHSLRKRAFQFRQPLGGKSLTVRVRDFLRNDSGYAMA
jgi:hypothetical protein